VLYSWSKLAIGYGFIPKAFVDFAGELTLSEVIDDGAPPDEIGAGIRLPNSKVRFNLDLIPVSPSLESRFLIAFVFQYRLRSEPPPPPPIDGKCTPSGMACS
jgi:hypothetical protein